jgi:hypothetical protein
MFPLIRLLAGEDNFNNEVSCALTEWVTYYIQCDSDGLVQIERFGISSSGAIAADGGAVQRIFIPMIL